MPELPEVETVRATLQSQIVWQKIKSIQVFYAPMIENQTSEEFINHLVGQTIREVKRYGKYLIFIFDTVSMICHLRMEGKFFIKEENEPVVKHEHVIFHFENLQSLRYHDTRKFGKMAIVPSTQIEEIMKYPSLAKLGKEANSEALEARELYQKIHKKKEAIKTALLNQEILAGLGNIYVDEVCFLSKLYPGQPCCTLSVEDCNHILINSRKVLKGAIAAGGTTIRSYTSSLGVTGRFQLSLHVHMQKGKPCENCATIIEKTVIGGRGTYFCPICQKVRKPVVVGITGGIASGKSVITTYLKEKNYPVIDSDQIVHQLLKTEKVKQKIRTIFGDEYMKEKEVDNKKLAKYIFSHPEGREKLNQIIHPLVKQKIEEEIQYSPFSLLFVDVPLLYEAHFESLCDKVIVVFVGLEQNISRLMKRDQIDAAYAKQKIASQMSLEEKCRKADYIIDNSLDLCYTYNQLEKILKQIQSQ